jgi:hypothetical protein
VDRLEAARWYRALLESGLAIDGNGDVEAMEFYREWSFLLMEFGLDCGPIQRKPY